VNKLNLLYNTRPLKIRTDVNTAKIQTCCIGKIYGLHSTSYIMTKYTKFHHLTDAKYKNIAIRKWANVWHRAPVFNDHIFMHKMK